MVETAAAGQGRTIVLEVSLSEHPTADTDRSVPAAGSGRFRDQADDPTAPPGGMPSLAQDRSVLAWLHQSPQLSQTTTGYLCDALVEWALLGLPWPDEAEPAAGAAGEHLIILRDIIERLLMRIDVAAPLSATLDLGRIGGLLQQALWCELDPEGLRQSQSRELLHRMPQLADPPARVVLADGRVL
jgi:hypothetical protein